AALTEREAQVLFGIMHSLAARGISIIYISHRMVEIFEHCDRVSVFRDGKRIMTEDVAKVTSDDIVNSMVGRVIGKLYPPKLTTEERSAEAIFTVAGLSDGKRFHDVSFALRKGEILGIAGLIGAGRSEIVKGICGMHPAIAGEVALNGTRLPLGSYRQSIDNGVVYLSEDRKGDGVFLDLPIAANVSALNLRQVSTP